MAVTSLTTRKIAPNIKLLVWPVLSLVILLVLFFLLFQNALPQVSSKLNSLNESRTQEKALQAKLESLKGITPSLLDYTNTSLSSLPDKDSSLWLVSTIKSQAQGSSSNVTKYEVRKSGADTKTGVNSTTLDINLSSTDLMTVLELFKRVQTMDPVNTFDSITISVSQNSFISNAKINSYWSPLPTKFGSVDQPVTDLSDKDKALVAKLEGYLKPDFTVLTSQTSGGRDNPFQ